MRDLSAPAAMFRKDGTAQEVDFRMISRMRNDPSSKRVSLVSRRKLVPLGWNYPESTVPRGQDLASATRLWRRLDH